MSEANVKRWAFSLFLKWLMSETVRKSAGREFHAAGPEKETARSPREGSCGNGRSINVLEVLNHKPSNYDVPKWAVEWTGE